MAGNFARISLVVLLALGACDDAPQSVVPEAAPTLTRTEDQAPIADVVEIAGDVCWQTSGATVWAPTHVMQRLGEGDAIQTMTGATSLLRFWSDDSRMRLAPETTVRISAQPPDATRVRQLSGRMVARLEPGDDRRLEITLPPGTLVLTRDESQQGAVEAHLDVKPTRTDIEMVNGEGRFERRSGGHALIIAEATYVALQEDGEVLEQGARGELVVLTTPEDGDDIATRGRVHFQWEPTSDAETYQLALALTGSMDIRHVETRATEADVELESGRYSWSVRGMRGGGTFPAGETRHLTVVRDRTPPVLVVTSPAPGARVRATLLVRGRTEPGATLTVDGRPITVGEDGAFSVRRPQARGLANVVIQSTDSLGNRRIVSRQVIRR